LIILENILRPHRPLLGLSLRVSMGLSLRVSLSLSLSLKVKV